MALPLSVSVYIGHAGPPTPASTIREDIWEMGACPIGKTNEIF